MAIRLTLLLISAILCGVHGQFQRQTYTPAPTQQNEVPPNLSTFSHIDMLRELYFSLEKALWRVIRAGVGQEYVLQRIHAVHLRFFGEKFNENGVDLDLFDPDQRTLHDEIDKVNLTVNSIRDVYLQTKVNDAQREQVLGFSRNIVNMTKTMDVMHNLTRDNDFFGYIKKVSRMVGKKANKKPIQFKAQNLNLFD